MSAAPASGPSTAKATAADKQTGEQAKEVKPAAALEEDDEFEDFPVESRCFPYALMGWNGGNSEGERWRGEEGREEGNCVKIES